MLPSNNELRREKTVGGMGLYVVKNKLPLLYSTNIMITDELKYTEAHEWIYLYKNHIARIGFTDYAQKRFGKIIFVDLPEIDTEHEQFDPYVVVESENMVSEVDSPLSGRIVAVNEEIDEDPSIINHDPYGDGWVIEMELSHDSELDSLMDQEAYEQFLKREASGE